MMDDDDLEELKHIFLDECLENIEMLEQGLMRMGEGEDDSDTLNEVFRAAHSIKGGGATFGFLPMSELTHYMETLLDSMRSGKRAVVEEDVDLLLTALDLVKAIQVEGRSTADADHPDRLAMQSELETRTDTPVGSGTEPVPDDQAAEAVQPAVEATTLRLDFRPRLEFIQRGNDPLLILGEVERQGALNLVMNTTAMPSWHEFDPTACYLSWQGDLTGDATEAQLRDIFAWVDTDCSIDIETITAPAALEAVQGKLAANEANAASDAALAPAADEATGSSENASGLPAEGNSTAKPATTAPVKPADAKGAAKPAASKSGETSSIRIATEKIDQLIDLVGELVITQSMLSRVARSFDTVDINELRERVTDLEHNTRDLQESVMQVRMLPLSSAFSRLPRLVRDLSKKLDKDVNLVMEGGTTELDKTVLERMIDPLVHIVRNSLDHGIETPDVRLAAGKPAQGRLALNARQESGGVIIEVTDDGKGINGQNVLKKAIERGIVGASDVLNDDQINQLVFAPSFSTAETVSDVSGRGVGMDVVRRNILDLGGRVHLYSSLGTGTRIEINLPLSLAILDGQLIRVGEQVFVIPILCIIETLEMTHTEVSSVPGIGEVCRFRDDYLSLVRIADHFNIPDSEGSLIVIVETHGERQGLVIDEVVGQQQVVIKPLDRNYAKVKGLAGATIMSDGSVSLIIDPATISDETALAKAA